MAGEIVTFVDESPQIKQSPASMQLIHPFLTLFIIVCLATRTVARASDAAPHTPRTLTLEECIRLALQHNFDVRIQRYGPEIARYNLSVSYAGYEPVLALSGEHSYRLSPGGIDEQNRLFVGSETEDDSVGASIRGLMPWGLSYSIGGNVGDSYGTRPGFIEVTNVVGTVTNIVEVPIRVPFENADGQIGVFEMRQPLMRNFWIDATRLNIQIDKADLKISELALQQQIMTTVTAVENAYRFVKAAFWRRLQNVVNVYGYDPLLRKVVEAGTFRSPVELVATMTERDPEARRSLARHLSEFRPRLVVNQTRIAQDAERADEDEGSDDQGKNRIGSKPAGELDHHSGNQGRKRAGKIGHDMKHRGTRAETRPAAAE